MAISFLHDFKLSDLNKINYQIKITSITQVYKILIKVSILII